ncbi:MAG: response regulator transcription factor [Duganella sp.]
MTSYYSKEKMNTKAATQHILVVDDHEEIRASLKVYLGRLGMTVSTAANAAEARSLLRQVSIDLIVLDVMMPGEDGISLCRHVAAHDGPPVILLTARHASRDKIAGLDSGADDYLAKPFDPPELVARIHSVLRRCRRALAPAPATLRYSFDGWNLDLETRTLRDPDGQPVALGTAEYRLLQAFVEHPHTVLSRNRLMDLTAGDDAMLFDRTVDAQISRLRKKLEADPRRPDLLKTIWGDGYLFAAQVVRHGPAGARADATVAALPVQQIHSTQPA